MQRSAMGWHPDEIGGMSDKDLQPIHVRHAGFKGFVGDQGTSADAHFDYQKHRDPSRYREDVPDHEDEHLSHFYRDHGSRADWDKGGGQMKHVDLSRGVYATQSHVAQFHINRYRHAPNDKAWYLQHGGEDDGYEGNDHPMFVTHQGRLHAIEGHHRIAAAIQRGDTHIQGWHFDLDKHPINYMSDLHRDAEGNRQWLPTDEKCPDCEDLHQHGRELVGAH